MNVRLVKGYVLLTISLLVLVAAGILLVSNLGGTWTMHVFLGPRTLPPAAWLSMAAIAGVVVWWTLRRVLPKAIQAVRTGSKLKRTRETQQRLDDLEKKP